MELIYKELLEYCQDSVEDFDIRLSGALVIISRDRCALQRADTILYSEIESAVTDWCTDNDTDPYEIDIEELIYS